MYYVLAPLLSIASTVNISRSNRAIVRFTEKLPWSLHRLYITLFNTYSNLQLIRDPDSSNCLTGDNKTDVRFYVKPLIIYCNLRNYLSCRRSELYSPGIVPHLLLPRFAVFVVWYSWSDRPHCKFLFHRLCRIKFFDCRLFALNRNNNGVFFHFMCFDSKIALTSAPLQYTGSIISVYIVPEILQYHRFTSSLKYPGSVQRYPMSSPFHVPIA